MNEPLEAPVGFADSELRGYERHADTLVVRVTAWNETILVLTFTEVLGVREVLAGDFSAAFRAAVASQSFLQETLARSFGTTPSTHSYEVFSFFDQDDEPSLEIVAAGCEVKAEAVEAPPS